MAGNTAVRVLLVGIVVLATVPPTGAAQPVALDEPVLTDYERVDVVALDGNDYTIYRYDSPLPYVDGLTVYRNGQAVERAVATDVLDLYARQTAVANLEGAEIDAVRNIRNDSRRIQRLAEPTVEELDGALALTDRLRNATSGNRSAWAATAERIPALEREFGSGIAGGASDAAEFRTMLVRWDRAASNVEENATAVVEMVERRRSGAEIDRNELFNRYDAMLGSLERLRSLTDTVNDRAPEVAGAAEAAVENADAVPAVGEAFARQFRTLAERLRTTAERASEVDRGLSDRRESLQRIERRATSLQERLRTRWAPVSAIQSKVYATFGEGGLVLVAGLVAAAEMNSGG